MPNTAENAKLQYEAGQELNSYAAMTDSGDHKKLTLSGAALWSKRASFSAVIRPNGVISGGDVGVAASGSNDVVDMTALTCYLAGVETSVGAATDESITRPATAVAKVNSVTINSGGAVAVVVGTDGGSTTFSETRGAAGGPPYIPTTSIEVAQVRLTSDSAAAIVAAEIFEVIGTHREMYNYPVWTEYPIGDDDNSTAYVNFGSAHPLIHTGDVVKAVYAQVYEPVFSDISIAGEFVPPGETRSVSSTQYYGIAIGASAKSLAAGTFTAVIDDGVTDALSTADGLELIFRFYPDQDKSPYLLCQGYLAVAPAFPADNVITAACTIAAAQKAIKRAS